MKLHKFVTSGLVLAFVLSSAWVPVAAAPTGAPAADAGTTRIIPPSGSASFAAAPTGADVGVQQNELAPSVGKDAAGPKAPAAAIKSFKGVNRSSARSAGQNDRGVNSSRDDRSNPKLGASFDGLNHRNQRLANNGNQFSSEPPDQGLCVGNGFVMETINSALRVFNPDGTPASGVVDLNTFYNYPPAIIRATRTFGPDVFDPSCLFDKDTGRFFHIAATIDVVPATGDFPGPNHLDLAVSNSSDPTGTWTIYRIAAQDDGTAGTPNHGCTDVKGQPGPCFGDYPHIGADANGFYITTNEYDFFGNSFHGAQIYAISKAQLAAGGSIVVTQFNTAHDAPGNKPGFTVWPAQGSSPKFDDRASKPVLTSKAAITSQASGFGWGDDARRGVEYFLSSTAADEAQCNSGVVCTGTGASKNILLWTLRGTRSLNSASPALALSNKSVEVDKYSIPPKSNQKAGDIPLGQCINDTTIITPFGPGCWQFFFVGEPAHTEVLSHLDSNDTRMQQVTFAGGLVWGALDTDVKVGDLHKAGVEYFAVRPNGDLALQGTLALSNNNLTYPAIGMLPNGHGVIAFTVVGDTHFPSAGYAGLDREHGAGPVHIAAEGIGPDDGFTSYKSFVGDPPRTRWGDYGAAAVDGNSIWIASEYIAQTCTLTQYLTGAIGSCGGTRTSLANWATRISKVTP